MPRQQRKRKLETEPSQEESDLPAKKKQKVVSKTEKKSEKKGSNKKKALKKETTKKGSNKKSTKKDSVKKDNTKQKSKKSTTKTKKTTKNTNNQSLIEELLPEVPVHYALKNVNDDKITVSKTKDPLIEALILNKDKQFGINDLIDILSSDKVLDRKIPKTKTSKNKLKERLNVIEGVFPNDNSLRVEKIVWDPTEFYKAYIESIDETVETSVAKDEEVVAEPKATVTDINTINKAANNSNQESLKEEEKKEVKSMGIADSYDADVDIAVTASNDEVSLVNDDKLEVNDNDAEPVVLESVKLNAKSKVSQVLEGADLSNLISKHKITDNISIDAERGSETFQIVKTDEYETENVSHLGMNDKKVGKTLPNKLELGGEENDADDEFSPQEESNEVAENAEESSNNADKNENKKTQSETSQVEPMGTAVEDAGKTKEEIQENNQIEEEPDKDTNKVTEQEEESKTLQHTETENEPVPGNQMISEKENVVEKEPNNTNNTNTQSDANGFNFGFDTEPQMDENEFDSIASKAFQRQQEIAKHQNYILQQQMAAEARRNMERRHRQQHQNAQSMFAQSVPTHHQYFPSMMPQYNQGFPNPNHPFGSAMYPSYHSQSMQQNMQQNMQHNMHQNSQQHNQYQYNNQNPGR